MRVLRHLGLERVAHEERVAPASTIIRMMRGSERDLGEQPARVREAEARRRAERPRPNVRCTACGTEEGQRQVQEHVDEQRRARTQDQHEPAADGRPHQHGEIAADRVEADRARQMLGADDVVDDELDRRRRDDPGHAVGHQERGRVPGAERPGQEQRAPGERREHQQALGRLDEPATVEPVGERSGVHGEDQVRDPVTDHGEAGEGRGVERLEDDPVAGHVLDALGRHAEERQQKVAAVVPVIQRAELRGRRRRGGLARAHRRPASTSSTILPVCASLSM